MSRTCVCPAWCMRAWCGRRAMAHALTAVRYRSGRKGAGSGQGRPRRQFPRGGGRAASSRRSRRWPRWRQPRDGRKMRVCRSRTICLRMLTSLPCAGHDDLRSTPIRLQRRRRQWRRPIPGPIRRTASIGPSCAVAQFANGAMTVWTHTQGVYPDRQGIAEMLRMPTEQRSRASMSKGSGCYGHNGADDAAADAALIARALPGGPFACSGCASRSMPGSRSVRRW